VDYGSLQLGRKNKWVKTFKIRQITMFNTEINCVFNRHARARVSKKFEMQMCENDIACRFLNKFLLRYVNFFRTHARV
jgi:hypothetical protein